MGLAYALRRYTLGQKFRYSVKHLLICREYPPAPAGGIGTYAYNISRLLAEGGETVHVVGQLWDDREKTIEEQYNGKLIIHRLPFEDRRALWWRRANSKMGSKVASALYESDYPIRSFSWLAGSLAERLVVEEGIDLIEAQDYEAPLYYFQLRRALGLGPKRHPPCLIHLHSPTEFIVRYNDWHMAQPQFLIAKRMEDYTISAADALLCPSRFLARQAEVHYELRQDSVEVMPYPLGRVAKVERDAATWSNGSVCYVGRLERRKGTLEWIEAAVEVARQNASTTFEFVGTNILASNPILSEALLNRLIPRHLKGQFVFHGNVSRSVIPRILKRARIAVVPSRWENFPNTCMEAMASGLPIIATPAGGTIEMLADGQTGWIAEESSSASLRKALLRALGTPPSRLAEMGRNAVRSIGQMCDNQAIAERHLTFRKHLVGRGSQIPLAQPLPQRPSARQYRKAGVGYLDVLSDYKMDGLDLTDGSSSAKAGRSASIEHFRQLVVADSQRSSALPCLSHTVTGRGWVGKLSELLATVKCLIVNPKLTFRVLHQFASE